MSNNPLIRHELARIKSRIYPVRKFCSGRIYPTFNSNGVNPNHPITPAFGKASSFAKASEDKSVGRQLPNYVFQSLLWRFISAVICACDFIRGHLRLVTFSALICVYLSAAICVGQETDLKTKIKELKDKDAKVRMTAVKELMKAGKNKESIKAITERLKIEKDASVRNVIYETLGNIGDKETIPVLIEKIKTEQNKNIKPMAVLSLGRLQDERAVPVLREIFLNEEESFEVRLQAANALSYIPTEDSVRAIAEGLKSSAPEIRLQAASSLSCFSSDILIKERRELIKKQAESDPDEKNRNFIKEKILTKPKE